MEQAKPIPIEPSKTPQKRPLLLSILCLFSFVYFSILSTLFLLAIFYSGSVTEVVNLYTPGDNLSRGQIILVFLAGFLVHAMAFAGTVLIWSLRKIGYYFLGISCLVISSYQLFQPQFTVTSLSVYFFMIISFGLFFRRLS